MSVYVDLPAYYEQVETPKKNYQNLCIDIKCQSESSPKEGLDLMNDALEVVKTTFQAVTANSGITTYMNDGDYELNLKTIVNSVANNQERARLIV